MIARLRGVLISKAPTHTIIDVGGVGYEVLSSLATHERLPEEGQTISLYVYTHVREDEITLFGFATHREKQLFRKLIKVNGIGPRLALNILSGISVDELVNAIQKEDLAKITATPGIGRKTAEKMIVEMKDKVAEFHEPSAMPASRSDEMRRDLISVLLSLGYKRQMAIRAASETNLSGEITLQDAVRETLKYMGKEN